ncbi:MAG: hypothetical protein JOY81_11390 [Alphaproteobacteria bacterium]|nr:hypothetical protein [Alphaproteobacteria bacterium]
MDAQARIDANLKSRSCGGCSECCVVLRVDTPEFKKKADVPCEHLCQGGGCGIYETRFPVCRSWHCAWRMMGELLPEEARPDKTGVLFVLYHKTAKNADAPLLKRHHMLALARSLQSFDNPVVLEAMNTIIRREMAPLWVKTGDKTAMVYPPADLADAILHPLITPHRHLLGKAAELRARWDIEIDL